jgi:hypothetical protein
MQQHCIISLMQLVAPAANYTKTFRNRYDHPPDIVSI